jgi:hypothetical protein
MQQSRRLDKDTVVLEAGSDEIIVLYPTSMSTDDILAACELSADRLERRAKMYRDFCEELKAGVTKKA